MDRKTVFTKTAKGLMEAAGKTSLVGREVRNILAYVDGKATVGDLQAKLNIPERKLNAQLATLVRETLIREFVIAPASITPASEMSVQGHTLDFAKLIPRDTKGEEAQQTAEVDAIAREIIAAAQAREGREVQPPPSTPTPPPTPTVAPAVKPAEVKPAVVKPAAVKPDTAGPNSEVDPIAAFRVRADLTLREAERRVHDDAIKARANIQAKKDQETRAQRESEEKRRADEERQRAEEARKQAQQTAERAKREAEEARTQAQQAAERAKRDAEEKARKADEQRQLREREELEKRAMADRAAEEMRLQREVQERKRPPAPRPADARPAEANAHKPTEPNRGAGGARTQVDEAARLKAREEDRAKAKAQAEVAARARKDARAKEIADAEARAVARAHEREREAALIATRLHHIREGNPRTTSVGRMVALVLLLIVALAILIVPLIPVDVGQYENLASEKLGVRVQIGDASYVLFPLPHLRLNEVRIGDTTQIAEVKARPQLASLWSTPAFSDVELIGVEAQPALVGALLWGRMSSDAVMPARLTLRALHLKGLKLPALRATVNTDAAGQRVINIVDEAGEMNARLTRQGEEAVFELHAKDAAKVLPIPFTLTELNVRGTADGRSMKASSFDGRLKDGNVKGKANLTWGDAWTLEGEAEAIQVDASQFSPILGGRFRGSGSFRMQAAEWKELAQSYKLNGNFEIEKGQISGVDLVRSVREGQLSQGKTSFSNLRGQATAEKGKLALRNIRMDAGLLGAQGNADVEEQNLSGRLAVEMRAATGPLRSNFVLSGTPGQLKAEP